MGSHEERADRWILVEAICLCARLEREKGVVTRSAIARTDCDPRVRRQALILARRQLGFGARDV